MSLAKLIILQLGIAQIICLTTIPRYYYLDDHTWTEYNSPTKGFDYDYNYTYYDFDGTNYLLTTTNLGIFIFYINSL